MSAVPRLQLFTKKFAVKVYAILSTTASGRSKVRICPSSKYVAIIHKRYTETESSISFFICDLSSFLPQLPTFIFYTFKNPATPRIPKTKPIIPRRPKYLNSSLRYLNCENHAKKPKKNNIQGLFETNALKPRNPIQINQLSILAFFFLDPYYSPPSPSLLFTRFSDLCIFITSYLLLS